MPTQFLKSFVHPAGYTMLVRWEHFGIPDQCGDLYITWDVADEQSSPSESDIRIMGQFCNDVGGNYETKANALKALAKAKKVLTHSLRKDTK